MFTSRHVYPLDASTFSPLPHHRILEKLIQTFRAYSPRHPVDASALSLSHHRIWKIDTDFSRLLTSSPSRRAYPLGASTFHLVTLSPRHPFHLVTLSPRHPFTSSPFHLVTFHLVTSFTSSPFHLVTLSPLTSPRHPFCLVTPFTSSPFHLVTLSPRHPGYLLPSDPTTDPDPARVPE